MGLGRRVEVELEHPAEEKFGDWSTNVALQFHQEIENVFGPRDLAEKIVEILVLEKSLTGNNDIEQKGFFSRVISEHKIFRIQDVTSEVHGVFPTILRYGQVFVQTAGTKQRFNFRQIPNPNKIRDMIIKLVERKKREIQNEEKNNI